MPAKAKPELEEKLWTPAELAERWHMSVLTLRDWRTQRTGPRAIHIGGRALYPESEVARFEASRPRTGTARRTGP
jgi:hypothetical protein